MNFMQFFVSAFVFISLLGSAVKTTYAETIHTVEIQTDRLVIRSPEELKKLKDKILQNVHLYLTPAFANGTHYKIDHPIHTKGKLEISVPVSGLISDAEKGNGSYLMALARRVVNEDRLASEFKSVPQSEQIKLDIQADLIAEHGMKLRLPRANIRVGDSAQGTAKTRSVKLVAENGEMDIRANLFDIEEGHAVARKVKIVTPEGTKIGRLVEDPNREILATLFAHGKSLKSNNLGGHYVPQSYQIMGKNITQGLYDGRHMLTLPVAVSNHTTLKANESIEIQGPLLNQGDIDTKELRLTSSTDHICEASSITADRVILNGGGNLQLKRHHGYLTGQYYTSAGWGPSYNNFVASDPAQLIVNEMLSGYGKSKVINIGSFHHVHDKSPGFVIETPPIPRACSNNSQKRELALHCNGWPDHVFIGRRQIVDLVSL